MLQTALGYGPLDAGLRLIPWTITFITVAPVVGALADRFGERPFMVGGLTLQALGMGWVALIADPGLTYGEFVLPSVVAGVGVSMAIPAAQNSVVGSFALEDLGKAAGANSMMRELGGVFGVAVAAAVFAGAGSFASADAFLDGFAPAIAVVAALSLAGGRSSPSPCQAARRPPNLSPSARPRPSRPRAEADHTPITRRGRPRMRQVMVATRSSPSGRGRRGARPRRLRRARWAEPPGSGDARSSWTTACFKTSRVDRTREQMRPDARRVAERWIEPRLSIPTGRQSAPPDEQKARSR